MEQRKCPNQTRFVIVVQSLSRIQLFVTPWTTEHQASLSFTISGSLLKLISIESVTPSNHLVLCHSLHLPSIFPSIRIFSNELAPWIRWPKYWSFSFSISPSSEYSGLTYLGLTGLISLQPKGLSRVFSSTTTWKYQFFSGSAFSMVQLSHLYMTTGLAIALTVWTFVSKVMSLFFSMLFRYVKACLPRSKCLLIPRLHSPSAVILQPKKIKSVTVLIFHQLFARKWWDWISWS